jgi:SSS family solute:Na+ symporter
LGGLEGVIWAEVIQGILLISGALSIIATLLFKITNLSTVMYDTVFHQGKLLTISNFNLSFFHATVVGIFISGIFSSLYQYIGSQDIVQRYNATKNTEETNKAIYLNAKLSFLAIFLFFSIGTLLYIYYHQNPSILPNSFNLDSIVPYFIVSQIPSGIAGFIIASIFASAQATISSSLNSISACVITDIKKPFFKGKNEKNEVLFARIIIVVSGFISTSIALYMTVNNQSNLQIFFQSILGIFGGPISGAFITGIFIKRVHGNSMFISILTSSSILFFVQKTEIYFMYYGMIGVLSAITISYLLSFILSPSEKSIEGLTYATMNKEVTVYNYEKKYKS